MKTARSCGVFETASHFAVNILASGQMEMSNHFARSQEDKFAGFEWEAGLGGAPLFPDCAGRFQCETHKKLDGGDHWIFVGKVIAFDDFGRPPLCFHQGSYSMVFGHPGAAQKREGERAGTASNGERMRDHKFFMMLRAIRSYQSRYQPKINALGLNLIESRCLMFMSDLDGLEADDLVVHVNAPFPEVQEALVNLTSRHMIAASHNGYVLTDAGRTKADECWAVAEAHADAAFEAFTEEQMETFATVLNGLL